MTFLNAVGPGSQVKSLSDGLRLRDPPLSSLEILDVRRVPSLF